MSTPKIQILGNFKAEIEELGSKVDLQGMELHSLSERIVDEITVRQNADESLQEQIDGLKTTDTEHYNHLVSLFGAVGNLQSVDTQLGTAIANEETKRTTADTDLSNRITNTQAYAEAVNGNLVAVQQNLVAIIQQEQTARANKDTNLQSQIDTLNQTLNSFVNVAEVGA